MNFRLPRAALLGLSAVIASTAVGLSAVGASARALVPDDTSTTTTTTTSTTTSTSSTTTTTSAGTTTSTTTPVSSSTSTTAVPPTTTTVPLSGTALLSASMDAFAAQRAVHIVDKAEAFGVSLAETATAGLKDGTLSAVLHADGQAARMQMVLHGNLYFTANAFGLVTFLGFNPTAAQTEAGKWISVPRGSAYFAAFSGSLTVGSVVQALYIGGTVQAEPSTTILGKEVNVVRETLSSKGGNSVETVYVRATGIPLPVQSVLQTGGVTATDTYSGWGKAPKAKAPKSSVRFKGSWLLRKG